MSDWTTADIARELGLKNPAVARAWVARAARQTGLKPLPGRVGDAKRYDSEAVLAAKRQMPGKGAGAGRPRAASSLHDQPEQEGS